MNQCTTFLDTNDDIKSNRGRVMTSCIAAIGKNENGQDVIIFATDHMISQQLGIEESQFEQAVEKFKMINKDTVLMFSGVTVHFPKIIDALNSKFGQVLDNTKYNDIVKSLTEIMKAFRFQTFEQEVLDKYKLKFEDIRDAITRQQYSHPILQTILNQLTEYSINSMILSVGFQNDEGQMNIIDDFREYSYRDNNFAAIGSGWPQAISTLMFQKHSKNNDIATTLYNVYKAKKNSEVARGGWKGNGFVYIS